MDIDTSIYSDENHGLGNHFIGLTVQRINSCKREHLKRNTGSLSSGAGRVIRLSVYSQQ